MNEIVFNIPMGLSTIIVLSLIIQFIVERVKTPIPEEYREWAVPLVALVLGIILAITCKIGFLLTLNITVEPIIIDYILTGIILSGGSTLVNELIKVLQTAKEALQLTNYLTYAEINEFERAMEMDDEAEAEAVAKFFFDLANESNNTNEVYESPGDMNAKPEPEYKTTAGTYESPGDTE